MKKMKNEKGATLIELVMVLILLINLPLAIDIYNGYRLDANSDIVEITKEIQIKALSDSSELEGEIDGALTFIDGEISENMYYRLELFNPKTKLVKSIKYPAEKIDKFIDLEEGEEPYVKLTIDKYEYKDENGAKYRKSGISAFADVINGDEIDYSRVKNIYIPDIYKNFIDEDIDGFIRNVSLHLPEDSIEKYIKIDTE